MLIYDQFQLLDEERLCQIWQLVQLEEFKGARREHVAGNEDDSLLEGTRRAHQRLIKSSAIKPRHSQVANHEVIDVSGKSRQALLTIQNGFHAMPVFHQ